MAKAGTYTQNSDGRLGLGTNTSSMSQPCSQPALRAALPKRTAAISVISPRVVTGGLTVLRQWGQGHRYRLAQLVAFEIHTGQHSHEATTLGHLSRNAEELRHRSRLIFRRNVIHEPVGTEESERNEQQQDHFN